MLELQINERKDMLTKHLEQLGKIEKFIDSLGGIKYTNVFGKEVTFGKDVGYFINLVENRSRERVPSKQTGYEPSTGRKVKLANFTLEYADFPDNSGVLEKLQENIAYLENAVRIYEETNEDVSKKFKYMIGTKQPNEHLENLGYFEDVAMYIQGKLDRLTDDLGLQYFRLTIKESQFTGRGLTIYINLDEKVLPYITMNTYFNVKDKKMIYPSYIGVYSEFSSEYMNDERLSVKIEGLEEDFWDLKRTYTNNKDKLDAIMTSKLKGKILGREKKKLTKECGVNLDNIEGKTYHLYNLKNMLEKYLDRLAFLGENLTDILAEQDLIMENLGRMFNIEVDYQEKGFSN